MLQINIGEKFYRPILSEGAQLNYWLDNDDFQGTWELVWSVKEPTEKELVGFNQGEIQFSLSLVNQVTCINFRVFSLIEKILAELIIPWNEMPFVPKLVQGSNPNFSACSHFENLFKKSQKNSNRGWAVTRRHPNSFGCTE